MKEILTINEHNAAVNKAIFSPNQGKLVTISDDMMVMLYEISLNEDTYKFSSKELGKHTGKVSDAKYSYSGKILATSGWDGNIIFWDMINEKFMFKTNANHLGPINSIQFSVVIFF